MSVQRRDGEQGKRLQEERPNEALLPAKEQQTHNFLFHLIPL
jgi:hypothetical protein